MLDCIFALSGSIFLSAAWMQAPKSWLSNLKITVNWKAELICSTMGLRSKMILTRQNTHPWNEISRHIRIQNTNKEMHTSLRETKLGETRWGRVPRRGDRLESFIDFWLDISQHFDTAGEKKITRLDLKIRISIKREIFIHGCQVYEQYSTFSFKEHWQLRNAFLILCKEPLAVGKRELPENQHVISNIANSFCC